MTLKIISFDVEGTLLTEDYSEYVWHHKIPELYARQHNMSFANAKKCVAAEYAKVSEDDIRWYDIQYWFEKLELSNCKQVLESCKHKVIYYPEVIEVLQRLAESYKLVISTNSDRLFLEFQLEKIKHFFCKIFSATSDFGIVKKQPEFFLKICDILDVKPAEVCHVGDRYADDFVAPQQAGIKAFLVKRTKDEKIDLRKVVEEIKNL